MDAKAASLRQKRQRFQCGRGCGKGQDISLDFPAQPMLFLTKFLEAISYFSNVS
jgi:hypothetical protein